MYRPGAGHSRVHKKRCYTSTSTPNSCLISSVRLAGLPTYFEVWHPVLGLVR